MVDYRECPGHEYLSSFPYISIFISHASQGLLRSLATDRPYFPMSAMSPALVVCTCVSFNCRSESFTNQYGVHQPGREIRSQLRSKHCARDYQLAVNAGTCGLPSLVDFVSFLCPICRNREQTKTRRWQSLSSSHLRLLCILTMVLAIMQPLASFASLPSLSHCNSQIIGEAIERYP